MLDQSHRVSESVISHERRDIVVRLLVTIPRVEPDIPRDRMPTNKGLLILEAGDNCGEDVASVANVAGYGCGLEDEDSSGPEILAHLEGRALLDLRCGTGEGSRGPIRVWYLLNP